MFSNSFTYSHIILKNWSRRPFSLQKCEKERWSIYFYCVSRYGTCSYNVDVFITVFSEYDFKLFHEKTPDVLIPEDSRDDHFDNFVFENF